MASKRQCVILTGPSGVGVRYAAKSLQTYASKHEPKHQLEIRELDPELLTVHREHLRRLIGDNNSATVLTQKERRKVQRELLQSDARALITLLTHPQEYLASIWKVAAESLLKQLDPTKDTLLVMHAVYYHPGREDFVSPVNTDVLLPLADQYDLTTVVTFIDDFDDVVARLSAKDGVWHRRLQVRPNAVTEQEGQAQQRIQRTLYHAVEVLNWRRSETFMALRLAQALQSVPNHLLIATRHHTATVYHVLFPTKRTLPVYLSHPISEPRRMMRLAPGESMDEPEIKARRIEAGVLIRQVIAVAQALVSRGANLPPYLPTTIDELRITSNQIDVRWGVSDQSETLYVAPDDATMGVDDLLSSFSAADWAYQRPVLQSLADQVNAQIKARDRKLVEQSKAILVWRPYFQGKMAGGVQIEIEHRNLLVQFGVWEPMSRRVLVMNPRSDINEYRRKKLALYLEHELHIVDPKTGDTPLFIEDLKRTYPPELMEPISDGKVSAESLLMLFDPQNTLDFLQWNQDRSSMESVIEVVDEAAVADYWQRAADYVNTVDELRLSTREGDATYPNEDTNAIDFVEWAEKLLLPAPA